MLSITSDYFTDAGCPEPYLRRIADAGFTHVHWCHHWADDFLYSECEIEKIIEWFDRFGLRLNDLHGTAGNEKCWYSSLEYERASGVELVKNRIDMAVRMESDVVIMHVGDEPEDTKANTRYWSQLWKSLDELEPYCTDRGVRIAVENTPDFDQLEKILCKYPPDYIGICFDSGHNNFRYKGDLTHIDRLKNRIISLHLHDNDGNDDEHKLLFSGTINWEEIARIVAQSSYTKPISIEVAMVKMEIEDERIFLARAFETGTRFAEMVDKHR